MKRKQSGMTLTSFVVVLAVVGFALYIGMKLFPMYQEYYSVRTAMKGLAKEPDSANMDPSKLQDLFFRRLYINYSENVKKRGRQVRARRRWLAHEGQLRSSPRIDRQSGCRR
nr:DUF4845 domain-containing protein [Xanthomonas arboricola]